MDWPDDIEELVEPEIDLSLWSLNGYKTSKSINASKKRAVKV